MRFNTLVCLCMCMYVCKCLCVRLCLCVVTYVFMCLCVYASLSYVSFMLYECYVCVVFLRVYKFACACVRVCTCSIKFLNFFSRQTRRRSAFINCIMFSLLESNQIICDTLGRQFRDPPPCM